MQAGRVRYVHDKSSVLVRLLDDQRKGQLDKPSWMARDSVTMPAYVESNTALKSEMLRSLRSKTYAKSVPSNMDATGLVSDLNVSISRIAGLNAGDDGSTLGYGSAKS